MKEKGKTVAFFTRLLITGSLSRTSLAFLEQPSYKTDQDLAVS